MKKIPADTVAIEISIEPLQDSYFLLAHYVRIVHPWWFFHTKTIPLSHSLFFRHSISPVYKDCFMDGWSELAGPLTTHFKNLTRGPFCSVMVSSLEVLHSRRSDTISVAVLHRG